MDPDLPLFSSRPVRAYVAERLDGERALSKLLTICGAVALALASVGIYGVLSYAVAERSREIGIRRALGALDGQVMRMVVSDGGSVTCNGHEHKLDADRLLRAREVTRQLAEPAQLHLDLPAGRGSVLPATR